MLMGALVYGIRYSIPEYVCSLLVAGGVSVFALSKVSTETVYSFIGIMGLSFSLFCVWFVFLVFNSSLLSLTLIAFSYFCFLQTSSKTISKLAHPNAPLGYGLCFLNLAFDGFTNATQDSITARYFTDN